MPVFCNNIINISTDKKHHWHWDKSKGWQISSNTANSAANTNVSLTRGYMQDLLSEEHK